MGEQLEFPEPSTEGEQLRDEGAGLALENADENWREAGMSWLIERARTPGSFTAEDLRAAVGSPDRPRAMGGLFLAAASQKIIVPVGHVQAKRKERHAGWLRAWVGAEFVEAVA